MVNFSNKKLRQIVRLKVAFNQVGQATYLDIKCQLLLPYFNRN